MTKFALLTLLSAMPFISYGQNTTDTESKKQLFYSAKDSTIFDLSTNKAALYGDVELVLNDFHLKSDLIELDFLNNKIIAKSTQQHPSIASESHNSITIQAQEITVITNLKGYGLMPLPAEKKE